MKRLLSIVLVIAMVMSVAPVSVFAAESETDDRIQYVSLGASNTNGYGIRGYLPKAVTEDPLAASKADMNVYGYKMAPPAAYPAQIAEVLGAELQQLAISSMRTEEVLYLLGKEYEGVEDAYMEWRFTGGQKWFEIAEPGGVEKLQDAYQEYLANAEVITIDLGWNNFGVYAFNNIKTILADGGFWKEPKWDAVSDLITKADYDEIKASVMDSLKNNIESESGSLAGKLDKMADVLTYATLGAIGHFDSIIEWIYENNPDAQIVVINIQNLADDLVVEFEGATLNLGDLYGELIDLVNLYRASQSPYAGKYAFADAEDVETFLDEIVAWDGDPTTLGDNMVDCFDMYDDSLYVRSIVEYMMVGQALSGLFQGFRDMAAGYGLEVFKNDDQYTYEFGLSKTTDELLRLNLGALDLNNPAGADKDVEEYGAAVAQHLKNLRGEEANVEAYDYVFENLLTGLEAQKADLLKQVEGVPEESYPADLAAGLNQLNEAIETIVPGAKAEFAAKVKGVYNTYHNTLNYAYDVVATMVQFAAGINELEINADSLNGFNSAADGMMGTVFNEFVNGAQNKFYYELEKNGVQQTGAPEVPEYVLDESKFDPALRAILVLAVRYELGNSFFAHPNENGHDQITDAVLSALEESDAGAFTDKKMELYMSVLKEKYPNLYAMLMGADNLEDVDDLTVIVQMLKMSNSPILASVDLDALEAQIRAELRAFEAAHTPEQAAEAEAACYKLYENLIDLAAAITDVEYVPTEDSYYVSLGDSTISGYGLDGYIDNMQNGVNQVVTDSAHVVLAQQLYGDNWKNQFANFCQGSLRADDMLLFLGGEVELDDYYYAEIEPNLMEGTLEATQKKFIENVEKADLISVAIGGGNFLTFAGKYINRVMGTTPGGAYELDWERVGVNGSDESMKELEEALDILVPVVDALGLVDQYLPEGMEMENPAKFARALAEGLIYGYASYNYYYSQVLERIKEINPDAQLLILGMFNPVDDWEMTTTIDGEEILVDIGGSVANLMELANLQTLAFALQNDNTSYVDVNEAETILEAENPGKELGFSDYYDSSFKSNGKAVHASVAGHKYIADQMADALNGADNSDEIEALMGAAEILADLVAEYYDEAYAYAYAEAKAAGYIDTAVAGIDAAIVALKGIDVSATEMTDEFKAELAGEIEEVIETLAAAKALITEADVLDQASLDALMAMLDEAGEAIENIKNLLKQAGADVNDLVIVPALEKAYAELVNVVIPAIETAAEESVAKAYEYLVALAEQAGEYLAEAYDAFVEAFMEFLPEADAWLYDWFYNNPDKVIAFFEENGEFFVENAEAAVNVLGYIAYTFGPEVLEWVMENPEEALEQFVSWYEKYGERTWAMILVYLEELGVIDAVEDLYGNIEDALADLYEQLEDCTDEAYAEMLKQIEALRAQLEALRAEIEATANEQLMKLFAQIEKQLDMLEAMIKGETEATIEEIKAQIAALEKALDELVKAVIAEAEAAVQASILAAIEAVKTQLSYIEGAAEWLEDAIAEAYEAFIDALIEALPYIDEALYDFFYNNSDKVIAFFEENGEFFAENADAILAVLGYIAVEFGDDVLEYVLNNPEEALEQFVSWYEKYGERTWAMILVYLNELGVLDCLPTEKDIKAAIEAIEKQIEDCYKQLENATGEALEELKATIEELKAAVEELKAMVEDYAQMLDAAVRAEIEAAIEKLENAVAELEAAVEELKAAVEAQIEEAITKAEAAVKEAIAKVEAAVNGVIAAIEQDYLDATTGEYTITKDSYYVAIGDETVLAEPSYADLLAEALEIEYTKIGEEGLTVTGTEAVLMQNIAEIVKADLITLGYSNNTLISFMIDQATSLMPEELDWSVYGYDELGEYVDAALSDITEELYAQGLDAQTAGLMVTAIESYAYAYTGYMVGYPMVVEAIHEINPDALVIMVGMNNALTDVTLETEGVEIELGEYVQYLVDAANIESLAYAMLTDKAIYVDAPDVETLLEAYDVELGTDMFTVLQLLAFPQNRALLNPSEAGHDYIKEQILNALDLDYEYLLGDVNLDGEVNSADTNLLFRFVMKRLDEGFTTLQMWAGDVNEDGEVNSADTNLLFRYVMKYVPALGAQAQ